MTRKERRALKRSKQEDLHHIFPRSRADELGIDGESDWNKVMVNKRLHEHYHHLFKNKTPRECINLLLTVFWGGMIDPPRM